MNNLNQGNWIFSSQTATGKIEDILVPMEHFWKSRPFVRFRLTTRSNEIQFPYRFTHQFDKELVLQECQHRKISERLLRDI
jgi:hypothetical protein